MTTDSPSTVGSVATRMSTWRPSTVRPIRPSWGSRRSAMSRLAMILTRDTRPATIARATVVESLTTPSMRKRTFIPPGRGSKWMSEAPRSTASATIEWTSLTTGASSADSRSSMTSASGCSLELLDAVAQPRQPAEQHVDVVGGRHRPVDLVAGDHPEVVHRQDVCRVCGRDDQRPRVGEGDRHDPMAAQHRRIDERRGARVDAHRVEVDVIHAVALGNRSRQLVGGHDAALQQRLTGRQAGIPGLLHGALDRFAAGEAELDDDVADPARRAATLRRRGEARQRRLIDATGIGHRAGHPSAIGSAVGWFRDACLRQALEIRAHPGPARPAAAPRGSQDTVVPELAQDLPDVHVAHAGGGLTNVADGERI